ncbi:hypothetical protein HPB50_016234 [Hyalomma asiaticum]|uniref:Uncharacterized protein n=1 Tax=Hyalomma asiaticum TaxID=266040 RepID=A0ACB7TJ58_HYAAI|nr:hypothetical protein HPB50_016234 [Hyalomma asiaticum]
MYFAIRPPPFLHAPGVPVIPWPQWRRAFQTYIDAAARDAVSEHKKALLLNALGVEGLLCYLRAVEEEPQPGDYRKASEDAYTSTLLQLDGIFNPQQFSCVHILNFAGISYLLRDAVPTDLFLICGLSITMYFAIRPPPFLHAPGVPVIPWPQWRRAFQTYIDAAARDAVSEHKKALLLNALGVEGLLCYLRAVEEEPQPGDYRKASEDAYTSTLLQLDGIFNPQQFSCVHATYVATLQFGDPDVIRT